MRCKNCRKKTSLNGIICKCCSFNYCTSCIQLEKHNCTGIEVKKDETLKLLEDKLMSAKYSGRQKIEI